MIATNDEKWMARALELAREAALNGEVPVGAVIVRNQVIIAEARNHKEFSNDPTGHAELLVIRRAAEALGQWRLSGCTLYVTLEPCAMCAGAMIHARIDRLVFATPDPKTGAVDSLYQLLADPRLNHQPEVSRGVLAEEASSVLKDFFRARR